MRYYRKIVGEHIYLSPFNADDTEIYTKWTEWMNDRNVSDTYGGHHNLVFLSVFLLVTRKTGIKVTELKLSV